MQTPSEPIANPQPPKSVFGNFGTEKEVAPDDMASPGASPPFPRPALLCLQDEVDLAMARCFIYRLIAKAFEYPDEANWRWLTDAGVHRLLQSAVNTFGTQGLGALTEASEIRNSKSDVENSADALLCKLTSAQFEAFESDYIAAFGHAARGICPINEIEYGDLKADALFQPHRLADLGAFYSAFGLEVSDDASERLDHICVELEFMSVLAAKQAYALDHQLEEEQMKLCHDAQKKFLREHLGRWTPAFTRRLERMSGESPVGVLARFTREFIALDCQRLGIRAGSEDLMLRPVNDSADRLCDSCGITNLPPGALPTRL
jgi:putative dimethyl sulfoxide reductase chaperone